MYGVKYTSSVIGRKLALLCEPSSVTQVMNNFQPITAQYFPPYIQSRNFAKRQYE